MAEQDWVMAGVYLVGLVSFTLLMSALSMRATMRAERATVSRSRPRMVRD